MPAVTITQADKYLGVHISAREQDATPEEILTRGINLGRDGRTTSTQSDLGAALN